jgi:lipopolysaccharide/colanic/teichoic acid biosynthesis glycosyltransferase
MENIFFKRCIDVIFSLIGIITFSPLVPIIGLLIKMDSQGPIFYLTDRVGQNMKNFKMYKFRTMKNTASKIGGSLCPKNDYRVTNFGKFLRKTKINELPQLFNILMGEMTFVGPRPEAIDLAVLYPEKAKKIFSVKPGLVGPSSIKYRNEEECYPSCVEVRKYYLEKILPDKIRLDLEYIDKWSILLDLKYIFLGVQKTLSGTFSNELTGDFVKDKVKEKF